MQKIPENFEDFDEELTKILENFDDQMESLGETDHTFHDSLIDIMSTYPDSKELIQFIVAINDKLETKNELVKDVLSDTLREVIILKQHSIKKINKELNKKTWIYKIKTFLDKVPAKYIFGAIVLAVGLTIYFIAPVTVTNFVQTISKLK